MIRRQHAARTHTADGGFGLVEVIVSMLILGLVSTGLIAGTQMVSRMTADNRARQVAANLAEQQLDEDRGIIDPFKIHSFGGGATTPAKTQTVDGRLYTITQTAGLIAVDGAQITCGSGKAIYYRQITVEVDWAGRAPTTAKVRSDTVISPNGRINDSSTGSIAVMVTGSSSLGEAGVSVAITPVSGGAQALSSQPAATDVDGCSYALGVNPGTYRVTISRSGSVDTTQTAAPTTDTVTVTAGATYPVTFTYDSAVRYDLAYPVTSAGVAVTLPTTLAATFLSSGSPYITSAAAAPPTSVSLYPYPAGYAVIAGAEASANGAVACAAEDPAAWGTTATLGAGVRGVAAGRDPGAVTTAAVPMGAFTVTSTSSFYLKAVGLSRTTNGQPGCTTVETFQFPQIPGGTTATLALPYGTYQLSWGTSSTSTDTPVGTASGTGASRVASPSAGPAFTAVVGTSQTPVTGPQSTITPAGVLTLDPRSAK